MSAKNNTNQQTVQASSSQNQGTQEGQQDGQMQIRVPQDLEYVYRDVFNVFGGPGEVIIELGNQHRSVPNQASISNRIVVSFQTASRLQQALTQTLVAIQKRAQEQMQQSREQQQGGEKKA